MHLFRHSSAESRLLNAYIDPKQVKKVSTRGQIVNVAPTKTTSQGTPLPTGAPTSTFVSNGKTVNSYDTPLPSTPQGNLFAGSSNYNINLDPTYSGMIGAETGYTGDPLTAGNVGPSKGQSWSGGEMRADGTMAGGSNAQPFKSVAQRATEAANAADSALVQGNYLDPAQRLAARQQAEALVYAQAQAEQQAQAAAVAKANSQATQGAVAAGANTPNTASSFGAQNLSNRLGALTGDRQAYVTKRRAEGATDQDIRNELAGGAGQATPTPTAPTNAPSATQTTTTTTPTTTPTPTPSATTQKTTGAGTTADPNVPTTVGPTPASVAFRNMAALALDPLEKLLMTSFADQIDATPAGGALGTYGDFVASADGRDIAKGYNDANSILSGYQSTVESSTAARQKFSQDQFDRNDAYLAAAQANAQAQLSFANDKAARDLAESNRKNLNKMSNALAFQGGFGSAGGNAEVLDAQQKGEQAIVDLNKEFGFKHADVSLQFTQMHNEAQDKFTSSWLEAADNFDARIADIATQKNANETAKRGALKSAYTERNNAITDANLAHAKAINDATKGVTDFVNKQRDDKRATEQLAWNILDDAVARYGSLIPKSTLDRVSAMLPAGTDIRDYINTPTIAERNSKRISGSGGAGGKGLYSGGGVAAGASQFPTMSAQDLKGAVDRAMLKFGGTGAERGAKRDEYMARIANGEPTQNIVSDLVKDYWVTSTGTDNTAHAQRLTAAGNMDVIQSYADSYGLTAENDGPLGALDSRGNWLLSFVGQSSDAYTDLRSIVSNVKGQITKANAGTAVSAQEMALLKEYTPSMDSKGPTFFANVQNYKALVNYLDAKQAASDLGLPLPALPKPINYSGTSIAGPGKFSEADILSTLDE